MKKQLEYNKWYKDPSFGDKYLVFLKSASIGYGFDKGGNWFNEDEIEEYDGPFVTTGFELATPSEIESALLNYAKENYPVGISCDNTNLGYDCGFKIIGHVYYFNDEYELLFKGDHGRYSVYKNGKWAQITSGLRYPYLMK